MRSSQNKCCTSLDNPPVQKKGTKENDTREGKISGFSPSLDPPSLKRPNGACEPLLDFPGMHPGLYVGAGIPDSPLCFPLRENCRLSLPAAEKESLQFPQRSKIPRISASPMGFSGTARWTGGAKRRMRSPRSGSFVGKHSAFICAFRKPGGRAMLVPTAME